MTEWRGAMRARQDEEIRSESMKSKFITLESFSLVDLSSSSSSFNWKSYFILTKGERDRMEAERYRPQ
jgi:hypothetical protein